MVGTRRWVAVIRDWLRRNFQISQIFFARVFLERGDAVADTCLGSRKAFVSDLLLKQLKHVTQVVINRACKIGRQW